VSGRPVGSLAEELVELHLEDGVVVPLVVDQVGRPHGVVS